MKILLVDPKPSVYEPSRLLPLGLAYLGAVLEKNGHEVSVLDLNVQQDTLERETKNVDLVGFTASTLAIKASWNLCNRVKKTNPNAITVIEGPHVTAMPEESLKQPAVDIVGVICFGGRQIPN